jgi:hypothetical protein
VGLGPSLAKSVYAAVGDDVESEGLMNGNETSDMYVDSKIEAKSE